MAVDTEELSYEQIDHMCKLADIRIEMQNVGGVKANAIYPSLITRVTLRAKFYVVTWDFSEQDPWRQHGGPPQLWQAKLKECLDGQARVINSQLGNDNVK